jgi:hypothetical protein
MTRAPYPPGGALVVDRHELGGLLRQARDLITGLPDAIDDVRQQGADGHFAFAIALTTSVHRDLVDACAMLDDAEAELENHGLAGIGWQDAAGDRPGMAGSDTRQPDRQSGVQVETRVAGGQVLAGRAVHAIRGGAVIHGRPGGPALLGICTGPADVNRADAEVLVQREGSCLAFIAKPVRRGDLLTVDDEGRLVPAKPKPGKHAHCIAIAEEDCPGRQLAFVTVQRMTLQG